MIYFDKTNALKKIEAQTEKIILELGCGNSKQFTNSIAIDIIELEGVDIVCDLNIGLDFIPDNSIDEIHSSHFMEHVNDVGVLLKEIYRILKPNGLKIIKVPHFSNPYFYSDYTHINHFGLYSLSYFSKKSYFKRSVPQFYNDMDFEIINVKLKFKSVGFISKYFLKVFEKVINFKPSFLEYYEAHLCYAIPASEVIYEIRKRNV